MAYIILREFQLILLCPTVTSEFFLMTNFSSAITAKNTRSSGLKLSAISHLLITSNIISILTEYICRPNTISIHVWEPIRMNNIWNDVSWHWYYITKIRLQGLCIRKYCRRVIKSKKRHNILCILQLCTYYWNWPVITQWVHFTLPKYIFHLLPCYVLVAKSIHCDKLS